MSAWWGTPGTVRRCAIDGPENRSTSDDDIAEKLLDVSIPTLMLSLVHMTGDPELHPRPTPTGGPVPQRGAGLHVRGGQGRGPDASRSRSSGRLPRPRLSRTGTALVRAAPRDDGVARRASRCPTSTCRCSSRRWSSTAPTRAGRHGRRPTTRADASRSSSSAAASPACSPASGCRRPGIPFTIVEKNAGVGGTWCENTYPGARVDVGNHFYCYSFEPSDQWTEFFAQQPELQAYFEGVMDKSRHRAARPLGRPRCSAPTWDDATAHLVGARPRRRRDEETLEAPCGDLRGRPAQPAARSRTSPGRTTSPDRRSTPPAGTTTSTSPASDVAMIGAGASGFQIAPTIADDGRPPHGLPAHRAVDVPEPELPRSRWRRACGGRCSTCRSTGAGTAS